MNYARKAAGFGIAFFMILGVFCIWNAIQRHGIWFAIPSFQAIFNDPIYLYACADLGAVFVIVSIWVARDPRRKTRKNSTERWTYPLWLWITSFFVFGTPAFLLYWLYGRTQITH